MISGNAHRLMDNRGGQPGTASHSEASLGNPDGVAHKAPEADLPQWQSTADEASPGVMLIAALGCAVVAALLACDVAGLNVFRLFALSLW